MSGCLGRDGRLDYCLFCRTPLNSNTLLALPVNATQPCYLVPCDSCFSFSNLLNSSVCKSPSHQALFHEDFFGTGEASNIDNYINDSIAFRSVITNDYPAYFGDKKSELIFDVGAGRGNFLKALVDEGYNAYGCEFSGSLVSSGRSIYGLNSQIFFQLNAWDLPGYLKANDLKPTVLVFWHVIEHVENCINLLKALTNASSDQITLIFQTPLPVSEYTFPEHLFFPSTETYHYIADCLGLSVKLLYVVPYTRYVTCVLSNKNLPVGKVYPRESSFPSFSILSQLIEHLNNGLKELDQVTKVQYEKIVNLQSQISQSISDFPSPLTLSTDLSVIAEILNKRIPTIDSHSKLKDEVKSLMLENNKLTDKLLRAEAQLILLKDLYVTNASLGAL